MPYYMIRASFSAETWKALVANPQDRSIPVAQLCEQHGGKLHNYFFALGEHDIVAIVETSDDKAAMAFAMGVASSGAVSGVQTTVLVPASEAVEVMRKAGEVAGTYQPPSAG